MSSNNHFSRGARPRPPLIDLQQIRAWRQECHSKHGEECNNRYSELLLKRLEKLTLVDVNDQSLVILPSTTPFVALSYVWGAVPIFKALKSNIKDLMTPGSLASDEIKIADTVRDAINLVKSLGECYLWVDCLCIIQDQDEAAMSATLRAMANIYASAEFTIVAADGADANCGLRGTGGNSADRSQLDVDYRTFDLESYPGRSVWATRGWTFQESLFSRRLLVLGELSHWLCGRSDWHEVPISTNRSLDVSATALTSPSNRDHLGVPMGLLSQITELPNLRIWEVVISGFGHRCFTFQTDLYRAIAGATEILGPLFPSGLVHGLPVFFFDMVLLWYPRTWVSRRAEYPSWSWTGWHAELDVFQDWLPFYPDVKYNSEDKDSSQHCSPGVRLSRVASYMMQEISNNGPPPWRSPEHLNKFYEYQAIRYDVETEMPTGWLRHDHAKGQYYTCSVIKDTGRRFSYPLPFADPCAAQVVYSSVISCTAPRAFVDFREHPDYENYAYVIERNCCAILGLLCLQIEQLPLDACNIFEVIALSEVEILDEVFVEQYLSTSVMSDVIELFRIFEGVREPLRFYNVMYITWEDDVAVRAGLGMIHKKAWDALDAKTITFKLG
ncbi:heterokaryon incompatibility protein-domain-containing protein [Paraphoma chrysanthemicola]|uniref:Heterokaryon incompatibility protein-domain-containing protein n=1 Tax=Paraphoma chrysanthemicola TaxID=798071 RepID=A0A8K0R1U2_9PLEO|nr:heterokaryon incompatibility protein-domain-containing protein [Paraphoma chrysanthemicola]